MLLEDIDRIEVIRGPGAADDSRSQHAGCRLDRRIRGGIGQFLPTNSRLRFPSGRPIILGYFPLTGRQGAGS